MYRQILCMGECQHISYGKDEFVPLQFITVRNSHIGVVAFPVSESGLVPLRNLVDILCSLSNELHLITGGAGYTFFAESKEIHAHRVEHRVSGKAAFTRGMNYVWTQLRLSGSLLRVSKDVDLWVFFLGAEGLALPMLAAKLLGKHVVIASAGSGLKVARARGDPFAKASAVLQAITHRLSDGIIVYSERLVEEHRLRKYKDKISIAHKHFLDFSKFRIERRLDERDNVVGYVGALDKAKGIPNLLEAIPMVLERRNRVEFLLGGDGELQTSVEQCLSGDNFCGKAKSVGWIPHDELPKYLNELKLLVLPSYTEGLPNIILEAMACGTPVLATPVGAIPDIIKDGETGFIMENNSPECIAENIIRALNHPDLEQIANNARALVEREFTFEKAVERYRHILDQLRNEQR